MQIIIALVIIALLILVHEWGHFIISRRIGIPVYEFSLGFGYRLWSITRDGVVYSLRLIPLGGFVRLAGEEPGDMDNPKGLNARTPLEKMQVAFAGPFMNFVLALVIFVYSFAVIGVAQPVNDPIVGEVIKGKAADRAGLKAGDRILELNGKEIQNWAQFVDKIQASPVNQPVQIKIDRDRNVQSLQVTPEKNEATGQPMVGVYGKVQFVKQGIINSIKLGFTQTYQMTALLLSGLGMLISGAASTADLAGPVGITNMVGEAARSGMGYLLSFTAFLSINLGILNLLPIPALDGSRIVFALLEWIRKKPLDPQKEGFIHWIGFVFLMGLIILVTYNDIVRLIKG